MGVYRCTVKSTFPIGSTRGTNTWTVRTVGTGGDETDVQTLMGVVRDFYVDMASSTPSDFTWSWDGTSQELGTEEPTLLPVADTWSVTGTDASEYGAASNMAVVTWRTSLATRRGRGRTFIGPIGRDFVDTDGTLGDGYLGQLRQAAADLVGAQGGFVGTVGGLCVWSDLDGVARDFIGSTVTDQVAVLRSRRS